jgi:predicted DNA-binding helix-hairpin-helix protein
MIFDKLKLLENKYDVCGGGEKEGLGFIYDASTPRGKCPLLKTLQSNACSYDCKYCQNSRKTRKSSVGFDSDELAKTFISMQRQHSLHGLFLSSAVVGDADKTTEKMLESVKIIRNKYRYSGYIHFKVLP